MPTPTLAPSGRVKFPVALLVTSDPALHQQITDLAGDQHLTITTVTRLDHLRRAWSATPLVLLGADRLSDCRRADLPPRPGVIVVASTAPDELDALRHDAEGLGARHLAVLPGAWTWLADQLAHPPPAPVAGPSAHVGAAN